MIISFQNIDTNSRDSILEVFEVLKPSLIKFGLIEDVEKEKGAPISEEGGEIKNGEKISNTYVCKHHDGIATVYQVGDNLSSRKRYIIAEGSVIKLLPSSTDTRFGRKRQDYFEKGWVDSQGVVTREIDDEIFSPSLAASIILGSNANGKIRLTEK